MKFFVKILLFVFVALITNVKVTSATITFPNIQQSTTSISSNTKAPKTFSKISENYLANCCQNEQYLVDYRSWGIGVIGNAAKTVGHLTPWSQMTKAEARAFQHSYSRHASELGLPNWSQTRAGELQNLFNNAVSNIRNVGSNSFSNLKN